MINQMKRKISEKCKFFRKILSNCRCESIQALDIDTRLLSCLKSVLLNHTNHIGKITVSDFIDLFNTTFKKSQ